MNAAAPPPTQRLRFRRFTMADVDLLTELDSDPEVMRWITGGIPTSREEYQNTVLPRVIRTYETGPSRGTFAAEELQPDGSHAFVGWFHLKDAFHWPGELELGYRLRRSAWGRGLATEGSIGLIRHALEDLREPLVIAAAKIENVGSWRVMEKAGMVRDCEFIETRWAGKNNRGVKYVARAERWQSP